MRRLTRIAKRFQLLLLIGFVAAFTVALAYAAGLLTVNVQLPGTIQNPLSVTSANLTDTTTSTASYTCTVSGQTTSTNTVSCTGTGAVNGDIFNLALTVSNSGTAATHILSYSAATTITPGPAAASGTPSACTGGVATSCSATFGSTETVTFQFAESGGPTSLTVSLN